VAGPTREADVSGEAIRTEGLARRFGDVLAVDRLDLSMWPREIFGFLGPNGADKATTIRQAAMLCPDQLSR
jgi:ABC-2 type transport system ATP-binding protein